uniref:Bestrophin homolog n=1 Tax=Angiostrongylus cantonensis TaxID=6313 RepID=A0A0K0DC44_ANGCA
MDVKTKLSLDMIFRNGLRRAKRRQDLFLFLKALMLYIQSSYSLGRQSGATVLLSEKIVALFQTMCALLVAIVAVLAYYRIQEAESAFYTTQLFLEIHQFFYSGTLQHLIELAKAVGFTALTAAHSVPELLKPLIEKIGIIWVPHSSGGKVEKRTEKASQERSTSYKFKGNVQPGRMIIGSGEESMADSVTVQAPNKEAAKRDSKLVRHVMIDAVRQKQNGNAVVPMVKEQKVVPETEKQWLSGATQSSSSGVHQKEVPPYTTKPVTLMPQTTDQIPRPLMQESGQDSIQFNGIRKVSNPKSVLVICTTITGQHQRR